MRTGRIAIAVGVIGILVLASMLHATGGRLSLPLDDSFIYFQYARQAAEGQLFVYQDGDLPTTGATSIPWMFVLAAGSLLGFDGKSIVVFAFLLGGGLLVLAARFAGRTERDLGGAELGDQAPPLGVFRVPLAAALVVLSGPLVWGAFSGMEIALVAAGIAWAYREWCAAGGRLSARSAAALGVLATLRPEGALLALSAVLLSGIGAVARRVRAPGADEPGRGSEGLAWALVPIGLAFFQPLVNLLATGDSRSSGFVAKTLMAAPGAELLDVLRIAVLRGVSLGAALFGGIAPFADGRGLYAYGSETAALWVAPGAGILFLVGVLPAIAREWGARSPGAATLALGWIAAVLFSTSLLEEHDAHFSRYQMPVLPVFLIWVAIGARRLGRALSWSEGGLGGLGRGLRAWLVFTGGLSVVFFALAFGDNSADIDRMQIRLGESLRQSLEPSDVLAINDAGALAYFSERRTLDLVGLTSPGLAGRWPEGTGALWEALESLPPERRPTWFAYFPNWFELDELGILRRRGSVRLLSPSIVDAEKVLARADFSLAGSGDWPRLGEETGRVVDRLDVADRTSERAHAFTWDDGQPGRTAGTFVRRAGFADGPDGSDGEAIDAGRTVLGSVAFEVERGALAPAGLVARTVSGVRQRLLVSVDGAGEEAVELYGRGAGSFHEQVVAAIAPGPGRARVSIRVLPEPAGSAPLLVTHFFVLEGFPQ